jgi:preprotein translocase subunit SecB
VDSVQEDAKRRSDRVTADVSLVDFRLRRLKADLLQLIPELDLEVWPTVEPSVTSVDNYAIYDVVYVIVAQDAKGRRTVEATATFTLVFEVSERLSSEDLEAFGAIGVLSIAHPYVRELFHNLTGRMGLPPLLLEVMPPEPTPLMR